MTIYEKNFEAPFIQDSKNYYIKKSLGWLSSLNCPEYLNEAEFYLVNEEKRADDNFDP